MRNSRVIQGKSGVRFNGNVPLPECKVIVVLLHLANIALDNAGWPHLPSLLCSGTCQDMIRELTETS